jgi:hypothetical protein
VWHSLHFCLRDSERGVVAAMTLRAAGIRLSGSVLAYGLYKFEGWRGTQIAYGIIHRVKWTWS